MAVFAVNHPLVAHKLSYLRDQETPMGEFRRLAGEISQLLCYEMTRDLPLQEATVQTPLSQAACRRLPRGQVVVVPILRAGLGMCDGALSLLPTAAVGHIGFYRSPVSHMPHEYYCKLPAGLEGRTVLLLDPMLATGGTAIDAVGALKKHGAKDIRFGCILAAPEGVAALVRAHPELDIYYGALDDRLNQDKYILPGLGDAGDRMFGTL